MPPLGIVYVWGHHTTEIQLLKARKWTSTRGLATSAMDRNGRGWADLSLSWIWRGFVAWEGRNSQTYQVLLMGMAEWIWMDPCFDSRVWCRPPRIVDFLVHYIDDLNHHNITNCIWANFRLKSTDVTFFWVVIHPDIMILTFIWISQLQGHLEGRGAGGTVATTWRGFGEEPCDGNLWPRSL